jgi:hypothetical protein
MFSVQYDVEKPAKNQAKLEEQAISTGGNPNKLSGNQPQQ